MKKFKKSGAGAGSKKASRWANVTAKSDRTPIITEGVYTLKHKGAKVKTENGEWAVVTFEVVESTGEEAMKPGSEGVMLQSLDDKWNIGLGKLKGYVMALIGCPDEDSYNEFDPEGEFLDAVLGEFPDDEPRAKELEEQLAEMVVDREISCRVTRGKATADGSDYYRNFLWEVNESEDDA